MAVSKYDYKSRDDTGKAHPSSIRPGLPLVEGSPSGPSTPADFKKSARKSVPKGVVRGNGTENLRGTKVRHLMKPKKPNTGKTRDVKPDNVHVADGVSVPRRVKR